MTTYGRLPVTFARGDGVWLWDNSNKKYLDVLSGVAVCSLGHSHPEITKAICDQAGELIHTSNWYGIALQEQLAASLCNKANMDNAFFCNSGAEANEAAIKLARLYGHQHNIDHPAIIVTEGSFHGRTMATLTATGNRKVQAGFEPLVPGFNRVPYNDLDAVQQVAVHNSNVVAVMVEPVLGESGIIIPDQDYLTGLRKICDTNNWLLILDEIQTGMCRTGKWFACQHEKVLPDIMTVAKALGNGVPIGACLARGHASLILQPGSHGSTFGGNPLACKTALTVIDIMTREKLDQHADKIGQLLLAGFKKALGNKPGVVAIRGMGMMLAIELDRPCHELLNLALEAGLLINVTTDNTIRLLPPLILDTNDADMLVEQLSGLIKTFIGKKIPATEAIS